MNERPTTILAVVLGILKLARVRGTMADLAVVTAIGTCLLRAFVRLRKRCIENDLRYPDPVQTESEST